MQNSKSAGATRRRHFATSGAMVVAVAIFAGMVSGCSSSAKKPTALEEEPVYLDPFGPRDFKEVETILPAPPVAANLIPFSTNSTGKLEFAVDSKSISVGQDKAVRYTVVARSPSGAQTINFEAVRCDSFERKLFATLPPGATQWVPNMSEDRGAWRRMNTGVGNSYAATLAVEFLCEGRTPAGSPDDIVRDLKQSAPPYSVFR